MNALTLHGNEYFVDEIKVMESETEIILDYPGGLNLTAWLLAN